MREFFGVEPRQVADVLALMGDSVDNIPGVPGVGQVTAKKWISTYGSLEKLLEKMDEIPGKVGESLRQHREDALLSRRLAEIPTDLPIALAPEELRRGPPGPREAEGDLLGARVPVARGRDPGRGGRAARRALARLAAGEAFLPRRRGGSASRC